MTLPGVIFLFSAHFLICSGSGPRVHIRGLGHIRGLQSEVRTKGNHGIVSSSVDAFLGVPFAEPPIEELRFLPPKPVKPWRADGDFKAIYPAPACKHEPDKVFPGFRGAEMWNAHNWTEDCLKLNIWRPTPTAGNGPATLKTVMVWIYGGGFFSGSPSLPFYNGSVLAAVHDVIVVNINYRVSAFGFLFLDHEEAPGNVGLLDQQQALKWIYENIKHFGGDANKITLFGESAGSASTSAHLIAPDSRPYVNKVIMQSGSMTSPWACKSKEYLLKKAKGFVKDLNCGDLSVKDSVPAIVECLRRKKASDISKKATVQMNGFMDFGFVPVCQDKLFFKGNAIDMFQAGEFKKVPTIAGIMKDEGSFWLFYYLQKYYNKDNDSLMSRADFVDSVRIAFHQQLSEAMIAAVTHHYDQKEWNRTRDKDERQRCRSALRKGTEYRDLISQAVGDYHFVCSCLGFARKIMEVDPSVPVYLYHFTHMSSQNPWPDWSGAMHGYEIEFEFGMPLLEHSRYDSKERALARKVMRYWTDFAKFGLPVNSTSEWPPAKHDESFKQLEAGQATGAEVYERSVKAYECRLWDQIEALTLPEKLGDVTSGKSSSAATLYSIFCVCVILMYISW